jgi:hypothetical protein
MQKDVHKIHTNRQNIVESVGAEADIVIETKLYSPIMTLHWLKKCFLHYKQLLDQTM